MTIDNKFKGIAITSYSQSKSEIEIRETYIPFISFPVAIKKCGSCGDKTKQKLFYLNNSHFVKENKEIKCKTCNHIDYITYEKS